MELGVLKVSKLVSKLLIKVMCVLGEEFGWERSGSSEVRWVGEWRNAVRLMLKLSASGSWVDLEEFASISGVPISGRLVERQVVGRVWYRYATLNRGEMVWMRWFECGGSVLDRWKMQINDGPVLIGCRLRLIDLYQAMLICKLSISGLN